MTEIKSVAPPEVTGVCVISGLWGFGKTTLAMTCEDPQLVTMIDFDQKSASKAKALGIEYHSPADMGLDDPLDYNLDKALAWFKETITNLQNGKTTLIIDNGSPVEDAFRALVAKDPVRYGVKPANVSSGAFGGVNPGVGKLWESVVSYLHQKGFERIFIIMHMSQDWTPKGPVPNRYKPKGNKVLSQLSNLSLVVVKTDRPGPPDAVVMKEALGVIHYKDGKFEVVQALPPRIPGCDWDKIRYYLETAGTRTKFEKDELPTTREIESYGQLMSPEQVAFIKAVAENPDFSITEGEPDRTETESPPTVEAKPKKQPDTMTWDEFKAVIAEKKWDAGEVRHLLLEKFGRGYKDDMAGEYLKYLEGFYSQASKEPEAIPLSGTT